MRWRRRIIFLPEVFNYNFLSFTSVVTDSLELFWNRPFCVCEHIRTKRKWKFHSREKWCRRGSRIFIDKSVGLQTRALTPRPFNCQRITQEELAGFLKSTSIDMQTQLRSTPAGLGSLADCFQVGLLGRWTPASACWVRCSDWQAESVTVTGRRLIYVQFLQELPPDQSWGPEWSGVLALLLRDWDYISINILPHTGRARTLWFAQPHLRRLVM